MISVMLPDTSCYKLSEKHSFKIEWDNVTTNANIRHKYDNIGRRQKKSKERRMYICIPIQLLQYLSLQKIYHEICH